MTPERYRQAEELFYAALELAPQARAGFLANACATDSAMRAEVESLLGAHEQTGRFIDEPPLAAAAQMIAKLETEARAGQMIGRYRIVRLLGKGGMGEVYLAEDTRLNRRAALKLLPIESTRDDTRVRRFIQEARAASALNHPNIIAVYEIGEEAGLHFMATELVEGPTLREALRRQPLSFAMILEVAIQTAAALAAAHAAGIVHRDIKPENIMLRPDGLVKVLDFGLAKLMTGRKPQGVRATGQSQELTGPGVILGTLPYLSPERVRMLPADARSDIFSLGVVLYEMIAGRAPFEGKNLKETISAVLATEPPPLAAFRPETPPELQRIVSKTLRKDLTERYQTCKALLADLRKAKQQWEFSMDAVTGSFRRTLIIKLPRTDTLLAESTQKTAMPWQYVLIALLASLLVGLILWWQAR